MNATSPKSQAPASDRGLMTRSRAGSHQELNVERWTLDVERSARVWARCCSLLLLSLLFLAPAAPARINLVTLPGRDTVQLTIYNSADLTLVKETRHLTLRRGLNKLEFSWANTLIDPTSVEFRALTHADEVEVLDASFPPRVTNTLEWRIQSEHAGEVVVEIRYFTSGISWSADYVAEAVSREDLMNLAGQVRVNNRSGEDYENAQVRLVVGVIRLVENIADFLAPSHPGQLSTVRDVPCEEARWTGTRLRTGWIREEWELGGTGARGGLQAGGLQGSKTGNPRISPRESES